MGIDPHVLLGGAGVRVTGVPVPGLVGAIDVVMLR
jgi:hypothetical protein